MFSADRSEIASDGAVAERRLFKLSLFVATLLAFIAGLTLLSDDARAAYNVPGFGLTPSTTQAAAHPDTSALVSPDAANADQTGGDDLKKLELDLPVGMLLNPQAATQRCVASGTGSSNKFLSDACPAASQVGSVAIAWRESATKSGSATGTAYVLTPTTSGSAMTLGLVIRPQGWKKMFVKAEAKSIVAVRPAGSTEYGVAVTIDNFPRVLTPTLGLSRSITISSLSIDFAARTGGPTINGPYFSTNPTRCTAAKTRATITSYKGVKIVKASEFLPTGCTEVPFDVAATVVPLNQTPGASTGLQATVDVATADAATQSSHVQSVQLDLPEGSSLNSVGVSAIGGLCSDSQLQGDTCPSSSKIGTASASTPLLPTAMTGDLYLMSRGTAPTVGLVLRGGGSKLMLKGSVTVTDRVRISFSALPQLPFSSVTVRLNSPLVKNPTSLCGGPQVTTLSGWSGATASIVGQWFGNTGSCAPDTTITNAPPPVTAQTDVDFSFTATLADATFACQIDGGEWVACVSPQAYTGLDEGSHTFCVQATRGAYPDPTPACVTFLIDSIAPSVSLNCSGLADSSARSCAWTVDDPSATVTCSVDSVPLGPPCPNPFDVVGYGLHSVVMRAVDPAGNVSMTIYDMVIPQPLFVQITSPSNNSNTTASSTNVSYVVNGSASIPSGTACVVNGAHTTSTTNIPVALSMGPNTISVYCVNAFGSSNTATVTVNRGVPPVVAITEPTSYPPTSPFNVAYTVNGVASIPSGTTCTVNGAPSTSATTNSVVRPAGTVTVTVMCTNVFGSGATSGSFPPPTVPTVVITSPPNGSQTSSPTVNVSYVVNGSSTIPPGVACAVNGAPSSTPSSNSVALNIGANTITVTCANAFGAGSTTVVVNYAHYDVFIVAPLDNSFTTQSTINVAYALGGSGSLPPGTTCTINGAPSSNGQTNPVNLVMGVNVITLVCQTPFGSTSDQVTVTRGNPPIVAITSPAGGQPTTTPTINVSYTVNGMPSIPPGTTCTVNGMPSSSATSNAVPLGQPPTVTVTCTNQFGSGTDSLTMTSVPAPIVVITAPANNSWTPSPTTNVRFNLNGSSTIPPDHVCVVNGVSTTSSQVNTVQLANGANTIIVACTNSFGSGSASTVVNRDSTPPAIGQPTFSQTTSPGPSIVTYSSSDNSGIAPTCNPPSGSVIQLQSGPNTITITCTDAAGNATAISASLVIGTTSGFTASIISGPPSTTPDNTPTFGYETNVEVWRPYPCPVGQTCVQVVEQVVAFQCTMDGGSVPCGVSTQYGGQYTSPALPDGPHTFCATGRNLLNGQLSNTACQTFTVNTALP